MDKDCKYYGIAPILLAYKNVICQQMMFYMYLPIKMKGSDDIRIPKRLMMFKSLIREALHSEEYLFNNNLKDHYVYLTAKHIYVSPDNPGNRPGWHSDGFGTDDINYIWTNKFPTVFCIQEFNLSDDCDTSLKQMQEQADNNNNYEYPVDALLRLDQYTIHRAPTIEKGGMRTFIKISISKHKYNLVGNSHNYLFDYNWPMYDREEIRNHPTMLENDFVKDE